MHQLPLAVFSYNRPSHLKRLFIALESYKIKSFVFFLDGPKNKKDKLIQDQILMMVKNSPFDVKIIHQKKNIGLAKSMENGLNFMRKKYPYFVILEDDVVPYKNFFKFIKQNIKYLTKNDNLSAICGYQLQEINKLNKKENNTIILDFFIPWGWATTRDSWNNYLKHKNTILKKIDKKNKNFFIKFLKNQKNKKPKSLWTAGFILFNLMQKKKFIFPSSTLTKNIGFDGSGVNSKITNNLTVIEDKKIKINFKKMIENKNFQKTQYRILKKKLNLFY